jgi:hypothetical protein
MRYVLLTLALLATSLGDLCSQPAWRILGRLSEARAYASAVNIAPDRVLVMGGMTTLGTATASCEIIDVGTGTISLAAPMQTPRAEFPALLTRDSSVVVVSGNREMINYGALTPDVEMYDRASGQWRVLGQLQIARRQHVALFINDHEILVVGGRLQDHTVIADAEIFDITTGDSRRTTPFPMPTSNGSIGVSSVGQVLLLGGRTGGANSDRTSEVFEFDRASETWRAAGSISAPLQRGDLIKLWDERLLFTGGSASEAPIDFSRDVQVEESGRWRVVAQMPVERSWHNVVQWSRDTVVNVGGFDNSTMALRSCDWTDLRTGTSTIGPELNVAHLRAVSVGGPSCDVGGRTIGASVLVISGQSTSGMTDVVEILERPCCTIDIDAGADRVICAGDSVMLEAPRSDNYRWTPSDGLSCVYCRAPIARPLVPTTYRLEVERDGCVGIDSIRVSISDATRTAQASIPRGIDARIGSVVRIPVMLDDRLDDDGVTELEMRIGYDPSILNPRGDLLDVPTGSPIAGWRVDLLDVTRGQIRIRYASPGPSITLRGAGELLALRFDAVLATDSLGNAITGSRISLAMSARPGQCTSLITNDGDATVSLCGLSMRLITMADESVLLRSIDPNPARGQAIATLHTAVESRVRVDLIDIHGRTLRAAFGAVLPAGDHAVPIPTEGLSAGLYFCRVMTRDVVLIRSVTVDE